MTRTKAARIKELELALRACVRCLQAIADRADDYPSLNSRLPGTGTRVRRTLDRARDTLRPPPATRTKPQPKRRPQADIPEILYTVDGAVFGVPKGTRMTTVEIIKTMNARYGGKRRQSTRAHLWRDRQRQGAKPVILQPGQCTEIHRWDGFHTMTKREVKQARKNGEI